MIIFFISFWVEKSDRVLYSSGVSISNGNS
jgi:hypothetical protein